MVNNPNCLKNKKGVVSLLASPIFWVVLAVVFLIFMVYSVKGGGGISISGKDKIICDVTLNGNWLGGVDLERVSCQKTGDKCLLGFGILDSINPLKKEGKINIYMNDGGSSSKDYNLYLTGGDEETYKINVCSSSNYGVVEVVNQAGSIEDRGDFIVK